MVAEAHALGIKVMSLVGKVKDAVNVARGGIDAVICTGTAAGGHSGDVDGMVLVPHVVERVAPVPVVAGGGIVDGRGLAAALALGAIGVWVGSRFIASRECSAPDWYKQRIVDAGDDATVRSKWYTGKTCRHLRSEWDTAWDASGLAALPMPDQALLTTPMALGAASVGRHLESGIFCGQGVARIASVLPAHEIVTRMIDQARDILQRELPARVSFN